MKWTLLAIASTWAGFFATGLIVGLCINRADARRIPEHPSLRSAREVTPTMRRMAVGRALSQQPKVVYLKRRPYDWKEMGG